MNTVAALLVFLYPLGMPIITLGSFVVLTVLSNGKVGAIAWRGLVVVVALVAVLGPSVVRNGSGAFALPWWLVRRRGGTEYYVWHYAFVCLSLLLCALVVSSLYRLVVRTRRMNGGAHVEP